MNQNLIPFLLSGFSVLLPNCKCSKEVTSPPWVSLSSFTGMGRSEATVFVIGNFAYLAGGWDGVRRYNDLWQFDPSGINGSWLQMASMPAFTKTGAGTGRSSAVGFIVGQEGYVGTGYDGYNYLQDFWQYDVASNSWTQKADFLGGPRYEAVAFGIGNYGYVSTGYDGLNAQKDLWRYDPSKDVWEAKYDLVGEKRYSAVAFVYNNKGYIVTGVDNGSAVNDFWMYDPYQPDSNSWTQLRPITKYSTSSYDNGYTTIARWNAVAFIILGTNSGDNAYITTGENGSLFSYTWAYNFATDLWQEKPPFAGGARTGAIGFSVQNRGFVGLGRSSSVFDDLREFHPNQ